MNTVMLSFVIFNKVIFIIYCLLFESFILNTLVLTTWGRKPTTGQLSGLVYKTAAQEEKHSNDKQ